MLKITIPAVELYDEKTNRFYVNSKPQTLALEHSLVSISKWESKWHKPFLTDTEKTTEEAIDYVRCMTLTQNVDPEVYKFLTAENFRDVNAYIEDPMTASWVTEPQGANKRSSEVITSELIYYWMIALNIPVEFQKWHLNRLLMLIKVCNAKNAPDKKMSRGDILRRNRALNAARRKAMGSRG